MSLGGGASTTLQQAVQYAWAGGGAGGSVLVAAGRQRRQLERVVSGRLRGGRFRCGERQPRRRTPRFSNTNSDVEVDGPGVNVLSTYGSGNTAYSTLSGTSMATSTRLGRDGDHLGQVP